MKLVDLECGFARRGRERLVRVSIVLLLMLSFHSRSSGAAELTLSNGWVLEGRVFYKTQAQWLTSSRGLVEGTSSLEVVLDEVRASAPALGNLIPDGIAVPRHALLSVHTARGTGRWIMGESLELSAALELGALVASAPAFTSGGGFALSFAGGSEVVRRRLIDFDHTIVSAVGMRAEANLDQLALRIVVPFGDLIVGRQVLSFGTGRFWNPTDLLSPFAPTDLDREVRHGIDAVRVSVDLDELTQIEALWLPLAEVEDMGGVVRFRTNLFDFDGSLTIGKYVRDLVIGADFAGDVGPIGVHGEAAWTLELEGLDEGAESFGRKFIRAVGGFEARPFEELVVMAEYQYNGFGGTDASEYLGILKSARALRGEVFSAGRHELGVVAGWQISDLASGQLVVLLNPLDPSAVIEPALEYWFEQSVIVRAGAIVPIGAAPDPAALARLTAADVIDGSPRFQNAVRTLGIRSEYGSSPIGAFVQIGLYSR
ncbi:MAG: hypothetical protein HY791_36270 [Deltaproteobacteria bacterium]|nr:hypothetical protein [Deltaproteobacteria bacterium]